MKNFKLFSILALMCAALVACSETEEVSEYENWPQRNVLYIDSVANVARANADGKWQVLLPYGLDSSKEWSNEYYVYCHEEVAGAGTTSPNYNDTVQVNYKGELINGLLFDASYSGDFAQAYQPVKMSLASTVMGFGTAVQHMVAGDKWKVFIPSNLGYGAATSGVIPGNSTLIFDIDLVSFTPVGEPFEN